MGFEPATISSEQNDGSYSLIVLTSFSLLVSIICLFYIFLKLTLNSLIKAIFYIMAVQNVVTLSLMTVSNSLMIAYGSRQVLCRQDEVIPALPITYRVSQIITSPM